MSPGRWRRPLSLLAAGLLAGTLAGPVQAAYPATDAVNSTAFKLACLGFDDPYPAKMQTASKAALVRLGHTTSAITGAKFTRAAYLATVGDDWAAYVHSHGDYYWSPADGRRFSGFREDSGDCGQAIIYSKDIAAKRGGRQSNLVFISTCHNGEVNTTLPGAFGIAKVKVRGTLSNGPEFYVSYLGSAWDNDEWLFEQAFWDGLSNGRSVGQAFDLASAQVFPHDLEADWWGTYLWRGVAGPITTCPGCS
jgi:hypothetical protein